MSKKKQIEKKVAALSKLPQQTFHAAGKGIHPFAFLTGEERVIKPLRGGGIATF